MRKDFSKIVIAYVVGGGAAIGILSLGDHWQPLWRLAAADLVGTAIIFGFSAICNNSSFYDPYWSVAPILISLYWLTDGSIRIENQLRQTVVVGLVLVWAVRLTVNWAVRWRGAGHEDWRYVNARKQHGKAYWVISFLGIHLMPTSLVFLGCISMIPALSQAIHPFRSLDLVATLITASAIVIEARADFEINRFKKSPQSSTKLLQSGVWSLSRHPNYLGEIGFWWGLYLFAYSANPGYWWAVAGPILITGLFIFISIPMIEKRMISRMPEYKDYKKTTPALIPWRRKKEDLSSM